MEIIIEDNIIEGCLVSDRVAQHELYKLCYKPFMQLCLRYTKSPNEAEEVLNAALYKIFNHIKSYDSKGSFVGWMRRIVVNTALDHLKSEQKHKYHVDVNSPEVRLEIESENEIDPEYLLNMLKSLPPIQQKVFNLFAIEGYSHKEIGELLDMTEANSKWNLFNARKTLQGLVNNYLNAN